MAEMIFYYLFLIILEIPDMRVDQFFYRTRVRLHRVTCQILRSAAQWSCGFLEAEAEESIHEAYVQTITKAQHYVYIENQFFISLAFPNAYDVRNQIAETLFKRIYRAHK